MMKPLLWSLLVAGLLGGWGGCSTPGPVQAWEKGNLAKPGMAMDADPLDQRFMQHIYTSKENSTGGASVGGGGCGCN
jgi:hypothetical protein